MSASRDFSQKITFIYSPLNQDQNTNDLFKAIPKHSSEILKVGKTAPRPARPYSPVQLLKATQLKADVELKSSLEDHLKQIDEIQSRIRFLIQDIQSMA